MNDEFASQTERRLAEIWSQVLDLEKVSRDQDFFELGGDSLMATKVVILARRQWKLPFTVRVLQEAPVLSDLAESIDAIAAAEARPEAP